MNFSNPQIPLRFSTGGSFAPGQAHQPMGQDLNVLVGALNWLISTQTNAQVGTAYTLVPGDNGRIITLNNAAAITVTIPVGLGLGFACGFIQLGAGQVTFQGDGTSSVNSYTGLLKLAGQYA